MRRGEVWTAAGGKDYAGKPRPVVTLSCKAMPSMRQSPSPYAGSPQTQRMRPWRAPSLSQTKPMGCNATCRLMADKITTMPRAKLGNRVGRLADEDILRMNRAILVFLGLAG